MGNFDIRVKRFIDVFINAGAYNKVVITVVSVQPVKDIVRQNGVQLRGFAPGLLHIVRIVVPLAVFGDGKVYLPIHKAEPQYHGKHRRREPCRQLPAVMQQQPEQPQLFSI